MKKIVERICGYLFCNLRFRLSDVRNNRKVFCCDWKYFFLSAFDFLLPVGGFTRTSRERSQTLNSRYTVYDVSISGIKKKCFYLHYSVCSSLYFFLLSHCYCARVCPGGRGLWRWRRWRRENTWNDKLQQKKNTLKSSRTIITGSKQLKSLLMRLESLFCRLYHANAPREFSSSRAE